MRTMSLSQMGMAHTREVLVAVQRDGSLILDTNRAVKCAISIGTVRISSLTCFETLSCSGSGLRDSRAEGECRGDGKNLHVLECNGFSKTVERRSGLSDTFDMWSKCFEAGAELKMGIEGDTIYILSPPPSQHKHRTFGYRRQNAGLRQASEHERRLLSRSPMFYRHNIKITQDFTCFSTQVLQVRILMIFEAAMTAH